MGGGGWWWAGDVWEKDRGALCMTIIRFLHKSHRLIWCLWIQLKFTSGLTPTAWPSAQPLMSSSHILYSHSTHLRSSLFTHAQEALHSNETKIKYHTACRNLTWLVGRGTESPAASGASQQPAGVNRTQTATAVFIKKESGVTRGNWPQGQHQVF